MKDKAKKTYTNLYDEICAIDLIAPIKGQIMSGAFKMEPDGKIRLNPVIIPDRPWINASHCPDRDCGMWMDIMFKYYDIVPNGCRNCWKLAMKPKSLKELFAVLAFQNTMKEYPSKCGLEKRGYTHNKGGYGAFWYCTLDGGLKGARAHYELISSKLSEILPNHGLILKRGCTEMENHTIKAGKGGSEDWDCDAEYYDKSEALIRPLFVDTDIDILNQLRAPWFIENHTKRAWIEWAFEFGDDTYLEYTGGVPLVSPLNLYHDSKHKHYNYKTTFVKRPRGIVDDNTSHSTKADRADRIVEFIKSDAGNADDDGRLSVV